MNNRLAVTVYFILVFWVFFVFFLLFLCVFFFGFINLCGFIFAFIFCFLWTMNCLVCKRQRCRINPHAHDTYERLQSKKNKLKTLKYYNFRCYSPTQNCCVKIDCYKLKLDNKDNQYSNTKKKQF